MSTSFVQIPEISKIRRLPRIGKIRLGVKVENANGKTYPKETNYFVVPEEVTEIYGPEPTALDVLIPVNDLTVVMPTAYKWYGQSQEKKCEGNGERARRYNSHTHQWENRTCLCEKYELGECTRRAHLQVILPKVNHGGVYQIDTSSWDALIQIQSLTTWVHDQVGRFAMVPMILSRVPVTKRIPKTGRTKTHYPIQLEASLPPKVLTSLHRDTARVLAQTQKWQLETPQDQNPTFDEEGVVLAEELVDGSAHACAPITAPTIEDRSQESAIPNPVDDAQIIPFPKPKTPEDPATPKQLTYITKLSEGHIDPRSLEHGLRTLTKEQASRIIDAFQKQDYAMFTAHSAVS